MTQPGRTWRFVAFLLVTTTLALWLTLSRSPLRETLYDGSIVSGWALAAALLAWAVSVWRPRLLEPACGLQMHWISWLSALNLLFFVNHVEHLPPLGTLNLGLSVLLLGLVSSSLWGLYLWQRPVDAEGRRNTALRRWYYTQATLLGLLLGAGAVHGFLIHAHGWAASWMES